MDDSTVKRATDVGVEVMAALNDDVSIEATREMMVLTYGQDFDDEKRSRLAKALKMFGESCALHGASTAIVEFVKYAGIKNATTKTD